MFIGDLTTEQGKQDYENYIMNNVRNEINSYTKQSQINNASSSVSGASGSLTTGVVLPSGVIVPFAGGPGVTPNPGTRQDVPDGWLLCNGATVSRTAYSNLFTIVGTTYGSGDGSTTFHVPNLSGRIPVGAGTQAQNGANGSGVIAGGATVARTLGQWFGDVYLQSHTHTFSGSTGGHSADHSHGFNPRSAGGWNSGATQVIINGGSQYWGLRSTANNGDGGTVGSTYGASNDHTHAYSGTVSAHNQTAGAQQNVQPSVVTNYIIKT
jgi:microcystin-dependent protein